MSAAYGYAYPREYGLLQIREQRRSGRLLGHFCGSTAPTNVSSTGTMYVRFHSNSAGTSAGFLAEFALGERSMQGMAGAVLRDACPE